MRVKIGKTIYDSDKEPILFLLTKDDKEEFQALGKDDKKICFFPKGYDAKKIGKIIDETR